MERGEKPHKTVWVAQLTIPHNNGYEERYVSGVFASREASIEDAHRLDETHGRPKVVPDEDSVYITWPSGNTMRVNRFPVSV